MDDNRGGGGGGGIGNMSRGTVSSGRAQKVVLGDIYKSVVGEGECKL